MIAVSNNSGVLALRAKSKAAAFRCAYLTVVSFLAVSLYPSKWALHAPNESDNAWRISVLLAVSSAVAAVVVGVYSLARGSLAIRVIAGTFTAIAVLILLTIVFNLFVIY